MINNLLQKNIPQGWKQVALGELVSITTGSRDANHGSLDGKYQFFTCAQKISRINDFSFDTEAVLIAGNGDFNVKYYKGKFDAYQRTYVLSNFKNTAGPFIYQKAKQALNEIVKNNQGSSVKFIKMSDLTEYSLLLPPIKEQQKIAEILGAVDEDIAKTQEVIDATEKLKRGLMQQLFTRGIGYAKFKQMRLGKLCEFKYGFSLPETKRQAGDIPVYGSNGKVGSHDIKGVSGPVIIIGRKGTIGAITWADADCWPIDTTYYVENGNYELKWIYYLLIFLRLNKMNTASGTPGLNREEAYLRDVNVPGKDVQKKIVEILSAVDEKISVNKKLKEKLSLLKKGLMQDLLSGKMRTK